jgi:hypothetical protein
MPTEEFEKLRAIWERDVDEPVVPGKPPPPTARQQEQEAAAFMAFMGAQQGLKAQTTNGRR